MALDESQVHEFMRRLLLSRMRILNHHPFYGLLLMHMKYGIDNATETAYTNGESIMFSPTFLKSLSDNELDFIMMHEIVHVVLQHCTRGINNTQPRRFNIACDIVVNSNILLENNMDTSSISLQGLGESMHLAPDGQEGFNYTAEQVYKMLPDMKKDSSGFEDDHSHWSDLKADDTLNDVWVQRASNAAKAIKIREKVLGCGLLPEFAKRLLGDLRTPQTDWRQILQEFIQQEICDYSFSPPDRRMDESPFFLPDFNEPEEIVQKILFMIDTSGSISDDMMTAAFSEVKGAVDQFNGSLEGWLGFFDAAIIEPIQFNDVDELLRIEPAGGGGTNFYIIFEYVAKHMRTEPPACIIILTDGYAPFPQEHRADGIPVLWLLNNRDVEPPWGKVARIEV